MKIKTYIADNVQDAFYKVKADLGKDAIILQTKHVRKPGLLGLFSKPRVEVVAANDVNSIQGSNKPLYTAPLQTPILNNFPYSNEGNNEKYTDLKSELSEVKNMIKELTLQKDNASGSEMEIHQNLKYYYNKMMLMEVDPIIIKNIIDNVQNKLSCENLDDKAKVKEQIKAEIISHLSKVKPISSDDKQSIIAFIGATGVGKTTTIAKLAAHFSLYENKKVAMITCDTFRVGAIEQLRHYGNLLNIPVEVIYKQEDINKILNKFNEHEIVLIDTMGSSPNNKMQIKKINYILDEVNPTEIHMVVSATTKRQDLHDILANYKELNYNKLLFTKLDETKSYGLLLNAFNIAKCQLSYLTTGQNVPDDIEVASAEKIAGMLLGEM